MATTDELRQCCHEIFAKLKENPGKWGFHFSYSPEETWRVDTKALVLTLNPQAKDKSHTPQRVLPDSPWPKEHDFFRDGNGFAIREPVRKLLRELTKKDPRLERQRLSEAELKDFASTKVALASYIPWRTCNANETLPLASFAERECWGKVLRLWQPELLIVFGPGPFKGIENQLAAIAASSGPKRVSRPSDHAVGNWRASGKECVYNFREFIMPGGKKVRLLGIPHPQACGRITGWPTREVSPEEAPAFRFVREKIADFSF